jgi:hypothetical protein
MVAERLRSRESRYASAAPPVAPLNASVSAMRKIPGNLGAHGLTVKVLRFERLTILPISRSYMGDDGAMNNSCR